MTMVTYKPVLIHGRTVWDVAELPADEFEERLRSVRDMFRRRGVEACVVLGESTAYGNISYLTGGRPGGVIMTVIIVGMTQPTVMLSGLGGARGADHTRAVNFIEDVRFYPSLGNGVVDVLKGWGLEAGHIGIVGAERDVQAKGASRMLDALASYEVVPLDRDFADLRAIKRPREILELERSAAVLSKAYDAALAEFVKSSSPYRAALEAELTARVLGARDVRTLSNLEGSIELRPITEAHGSETAKRLLLHLAVERNGYWTESTRSYPFSRSAADERASAALAAMRDALVPGAVLGQVADRAVGVLGEEAADLALEVGLGQGIGLGPEPHLGVVPGSTERLRGGEVLSLRSIVPGENAWSATSDMFVVDRAGGAPRRLASAWAP